MMPRHANAFRITAVEVRTWMSDNFLVFYLDVIISSSPNLGDGLANLGNRDPWYLYDMFDGVEDHRFQFYRKLIYPNSFRVRSFHHVRLYLHREFAGGKCHPPCTI